MPVSYIYAYTPRSSHPPQQVVTVTLICLLTHSPTHSLTHSPPILLHTTPQESPAVEDVLTDLCPVHLFVVLQLENTKATTTALPAAGPGRIYARADSLPGDDDIVFVPITYSDTPHEVHSDFSEEGSDLEEQAHLAPRGRQVRDTLSHSVLFLLFLSSSDTFNIYEGPVPFLIPPHES